MKPSDDGDLPPGWARIDRAAADALEAEFRLEIGPGHPLEGLAARAIAQHFEADDVLFDLGGGSVACVSLTWDGVRATGPGSPATTTWPSLAEWAASAASGAPATPFSDELDLHSFLPRDAAGLVRDFVDHWAEHGPREVRIIHGKGVGAMRRLVHAILEEHPAVSRFSLAADRSGWGATVARIERTG